MAGALAWGRGGLRAVAIEPLAQELGVTKGSFYWHFKSRAELIRAILTLWEEQGTEQVILRLDKTSCPRERLSALFREALDRPELLKTEAAIGASALTGHPEVAKVYMRVQQRRIDYVAQIHQELGFTKPQAQRRAALAYGAFLGCVQLVLLGHGSLKTAAGLRQQVRLFEEMLLP